MLQLRFPQTEHLPCPAPQFEPAFLAMVSQILLSAFFSIFFSDSGLLALAQGVCPSCFPCLPWILPASLHDGAYVFRVLCCLMWFLFFIFCCCLFHVGQWFC